MTPALPDSVGAGDCGAAVDWVETGDGVVAWPEVVVGAVDGEGAVDVVPDGGNDEGAGDGVTGRAGLTSARATMHHTGLS